MKLLICSIACLISISTFAQKYTYKEKYRPQFHFTPAVNWTNDPNGLVYFNGQYNLFYQYNPYGNRWGHMSWGHATSEDLVHWKHLPLAIPEGNHIMIFSGSAVVDEENTTGFASHEGQVPLVAIYTGHLIPDSTQPDNYWQAQYIAYSLDSGKTWTKYAGNPVLDLHKKDFRDPKVFWYAPEKKWVMAVVLPHQHIVQLYGSPNLKQWTHLSDFGPAGDTNDIWECPDLLQVPVEGSPGSSKWVLLNSQQVTMQYFVGSFNGTQFINENPAGEILRPDYGPDYYAAVTYNHLPPGQPPILLGWANNWRYANDIPTFPWKSAMALPRALSLRKTGNTWLLIQQPVTQLQSLREKMWQTGNLVITGNRFLPVASQQFEMEAALTPAGNSISGLHLAIGKGNPFVIGYDAARHKLFIDRTGTGDTAFNHNFASMTHYETSLALKNGQLTLDVFFDNSIIEVFANNGEAVMTAQIFPDKNANGISVFSDNGSLKIDHMVIWKMKSAWHP